MTAGEDQRLAKSGAIAGLCPTTEANLGDGIFPAVSFMKQGGAIAIGSDSQITISPAEDLRMLEYSQRLRDRTRNALASGGGASTGRSLLDAVLKGGAACLDQPMGAIAVGKRCDIALLDETHPAMIGREGDATLDTWIFSAGNAAVKDVIVGGTHVVKNRRHINEERIQKKFSEANFLKRAMINYAVKEKISALHETGELKSSMWDGLIFNKIKEMYSYSHDF